MSTVPKVLAVYRKPKEEFVPKKKTRYELWSEYLDTDSPSYDGFGFAMFIHKKLSKENEELARKLHELENQEPVTAQLRCTGTTTWHSFSVDMARQWLAKPWQGVEEVRLLYSKPVSPDNSGSAVSTDKVESFADKNRVNILRGCARENAALDEAKAEASCNMGVGCGIHGVCYAEKMGRPEECGRVQPNSTDRS